MERSHGRKFVDWIEHRTMEFNGDEGCIGTFDCLTSVGCEKDVVMDIERDGTIEAERTGPFGYAPPHLWDQQFYNCVPYAVSA